MNRTLWLCPLLALALLAGCAGDEAPTGEGSADSTDATTEVSAPEASAPTGDDATTDETGEAEGPPATATGPTPTPNPTTVALAQSFRPPVRGRADALVKIYEFSDYL